jgi:mono/diheme cytochrome c family protein
MIRRVLWGVFALIVLAAAAAALVVGLSHHRAMAEISPPPESDFDASSIERGRQLAAIGNCAVCHTVQGGQPFAGGRAIPTPIGVIHSSNITPDLATGIGRWSLAAFTRALRAGVGRAGQQLYPVFPYDHFTHLRESDVAALYAFLMTRTPVHAVTPANRLPFPFSERAVVAGWNFLFLHPGPPRGDPNESAEWNRGAYLVAALGDCGGCHTPRNWLQAEETGKAFAGGEGEGWYAPALNRQSPAPVPWTVAQLQTYLSTGFEPAHGAAAGPMQQVTAELAYVPPADVHAIAVYVGSLMPQIPAPVPGAYPPSTGAQENLQAAQIYSGACEVCHGPEAAGAFGKERGLPLTGSTVLAEPSSRDFAWIVLQGISDRVTYRAPFMPSFATTLTNAQIAALADYVRGHFARRPPWPELLETVREVRAQSLGSAAQSAAGNGDVRRQKPRA